MSSVHLFELNTIQGLLRYVQLHVNNVDADIKITNDEGDLIGYIRRDETGEYAFVVVA